MMTIAQPDNLTDVRIDRKKLRKARGNRLPKDVAKAVGVGPSQISNIERGHKNPSADLLVRLLILYQVSPIDVASREEASAKKVY